MRLPAIAAAIVISLSGCGSSTPPPPPPLSQAQKDSIASDLMKINFPEPSSLEVNDSEFVVATFNDIDPSFVRDGGRSFAETALIRIREQLLPTGAYSRFRVTVNGASPGTGLISRYGSARFIEGGKLNWKQGE